MRAPAAHASPALSREAYFATLAKRHGVENQQKLARARVGIAGLGGLALLPRAIWRDLAWVRSCSSTLTWWTCRICTASSTPARKLA